MVLTNATGGAILRAPTTVPVTIVDDEVGLSFTTPIYNVSETAGTLSLSVFRQNGTNLTHDGPLLHYEPDRQGRHQLCRRHQRHADLQPG